MKNQRIEKTNKYSHVFELYCLKNPLFCHSCKTANGSFMSATIDEKNWFSIKINCHACGNVAIKGPYSIQEMKMLARMTARERNFDLAYVWHCFLMLSEYPEKLDNPSMVGKYRQWRNTILATERKNARWYDELWGKGKNALHQA
jgi:hypothetical protein